MSLEVLYAIDSKIVRAWNGDDKVQGNLKPKTRQEVVIFDIDPPSFESDWYKVDLVNKKIIGNPDYTEPEPAMDYKAEILNLKDEVKKLKAK